jgi:hypothetical protein
VANNFDHTNEIFSLAVDLVNQSNRNIFLTGKAGTGKTTFLRHIRENSLKQMAVVAPTGVAAINAGGSTIHSFFQLPFSPCIPDARGNMHQQDVTNKHTLIGKVKLNRDRIKVLQQLELLVIDEISMVRCDTLDAIDVVLRHFRYRHSEPFGGVQVLVIGDMYQLPPVAVDQEWNLLSQFYNSPYFFDSRVWQQSASVSIEFKKIYRQSDSRFIDLLNQVRNNAVTPDGKKLLDSLYRPDFNIKKEDDYIILTTHNYKADAINADELTRIKSKSHFFKAEIEGDFSEKAYPADETLQLKEGAQVMFIKNDREKTKRYYNGKIGVVTRITDEGIFVQCKGEPDEIEVTKETWENIRYTINKQSNQVDEDVAGSFKQYPLRLAWAITIHKSQGLTFQKAVIDAGAAFASGQVYVALSRCTSLEGIVLQNQITTSSLRTDNTIVHFSKSISKPEELKHQLQYSKKDYQQKLLLQLFDLMPIIRSFNEVKRLLEENQKHFNPESITWIAGIEEKIIAVEEVAAKFRERLNFYFTDAAIPEQNTALQDRTTKASTYFANELSELMKSLQQSAVVTDSKTQAKAFNDSVKDLFTLIAERKHVISGFTLGFSVEAYYKQKNSFIVPSFTVNAYATSAESKIESPHPELHYQLRQLRIKLCEQKNQPVYMIASTQSIDEMAIYLPQIKEELVKISGFGKAKVQQYGEAFLKIINEYCDKNHLTSLIHERQPKKEKKQKSNDKPDTKTITYQLYTEGNKLADIARIRNLSTTTIESHLAHFVSLGLISVNELVSTDKIILIEPYLQDYEPGTPITPIVQKLENKVTYGELRLALAAKTWQTNNQHVSPSDVS